MVRIKVPEDWNVREPFVFTIRADIKDDPRPDTNELSFGLFAVPDPLLAGPDAPERVDSRLLRSTPEIELPAECEVSGNTHWFKIPTPKEGQLQVELSEVPEDLTLQIDLFGPDGVLLRDMEGERETSSEWIYLRFGVPAGNRIPRESKLKIWWEEQ